MQPTKDEIKVYTAGAVRDVAGVKASPGAVAVRDGRVLAAGRVEKVLKAAGKEVKRIDLGENLLLLPGLVNAHAHLDLTAIGHRPYGGNFIEWIKGVIAERGKPEFSAKQAVKLGVEYSLKAGVLAIGDIAGTAEAVQARIAVYPTTPLRGVSYFECFGFDHDVPARKRADELADAVIYMPRPEGLLLGLQPHALYSTGREIFELAHNYFLGYPSTHLAETPEELQFVREATGPFADLLRALGKWDPLIKPTGQTPVECLHSKLLRGRWLVAHCNYVTTSDIKLLKKSKTSVAYCPRASAYFGHKNHRYRDMIAAGINVCLGTDSIICHGSLSILDEMRFLYQRDKTDPQLLLKMATVNGMRGLCMDENDATFTPGAAAGLIAIRYDDPLGADPLIQVLGSEKTPEIRVLEVPGE